MSRFEQGRNPHTGPRKQGLEHENLIQLIAGLTGCLDRRRMVETVQGILGVEAIERGDCVVFDDVGLRFGENGRVLSIYRIIDGATASSD